MARDTMVAMNNEVSDAVRLAAERAAERRRLKGGDRSKTLNRLERIRLVILLIALVGAVVYAWRTHEWREDLRQIRASLQIEALDDAAEQVAAATRSWGPEAELLFLKGRMHRLAGKVEQAKLALDAANVAGYPAAAVEHEKRLTDVQWVRKQIEPETVDRVLQSIQAELDVNAVALCSGLLRIGSPGAASAVLPQWEAAVGFNEYNRYVQSLISGFNSDLETARTAAEESLSFNDDYLPAHKQLAWVLVQVGEPELALTHIDRYLADRADDFNARLIKVETLVAEERWAEVADMVELHHRNTAASDANRRYFARAYLETEQPEKAVEMISPYLTVWPDDLQANQLLAEAYAAAGRDEDAARIDEHIAKIEEALAELPELRQKISLNPADVEIRARLGELLLRHLDRQEGLMILNEAATIDPNNAAVREAYLKYRDAVQ